MNDLKEIEYKNIRVLTTQQIAETYEVDSDLISKNFNNNKDKYAEGKHFICLIGDELKTAKASGKIYGLQQNANKFYLWTEQGAFLHAKSLNTDKAWEAYSELIDGNYQMRKERVKEIDIQEALLNPDTIIQMALSLKAKMAENDTLKNTVKEKDLRIADMQPKVNFANAVATSHTSILVGDLAKLLKQNGVDIGANRLFEWLRENGYLIKRRGADWNMPTQKSMDLGLFEIKESTVNNPDGSVRINKTPKVSAKGQLYFVNEFLGDRKCVI